MPHAVKLATTNQTQVHAVLTPASAIPVRVIENLKKIFTLRK